MTDYNQGCKITLYWLEQSRSHRILWLLEELKLQYELKTFKRRSDKLAPAELKEVHALGKSPIVTVEAPGSDKPMVLAESGAIVEYLCDHFGKGNPTLVPERYVAGREGQVGGEREEWMRYRYFMHYTEGSLMPFLVMTLVNDTIRNSPPFFVRPITSIVASQVEAAFLTRNVEGNLAFLEEQLKTAPEGGPFLCGKDLTAADILISFPVIAAGGRVLQEKKNREKYPLLAGYAKKLQEVEGYKKAVAKIEAVEGTFSASIYTAIMAGPSKSLILDPALQKYYELNANRYKYWRWNSRHAWLSLIYMVAIPGALTWAAYKTDGKYELRGKRRGDTISEW
ncbi:hypothetical protein N7448_007269 [Penicillium atrosanguineum]|uniref:glutathione transferase n=1 Tax=Penicillium atrosanguineum TaxID=1132637 RepID=A0A9W9QFF4_9EURO|nr:uncharacterized protein N7443_001701 [Penicillium atrosanguineum]KAJ5126490.1 hypothetical protein N7448_007269 [Penicillium atrosanguineum]KAJ5314817.1 hypothetical protein N7443_001701 [Penicillium atrosanguineum]KAJ5331989.1 hypothetical protein N7476_001772 [Penicillium atrosanguineum]